jgi:hypothetical protein
MTPGIRALALLLLLGSATRLGGCATVKPWEKERLADPMMSFDDTAREAARELHWIEAREGSTGGTGTAGGGCACN